MTLLAIDPGAEIGAWVAAAAGTYALGRQIYEAFRKGRKEQKEIDKALDRTPEIRQQMELGNVGEAIKHLNDIIESQARDHVRQSRIIEDQEQDIESLKARAELAEDKNRGCELMVEQEKRLREKAELDLEEAKRNFARTVERLRRSHTKVEDDTPDLG